MPKKVPHLLTDLVIEEASIVDAAANRGSKVILLKSECDNMESDKERIGFIATLAKYLNVGKQEGDTLVIKTEDEPVSDDLVKLQKTVGTQGTVILKMAAQLAFGAMISVAKDAIAKAKEVTGVDSLLAKAKTDLVLLIKSGEVTDQKDLVKQFEAEIDGDLTERAKARKAELEKSTNKAQMNEFRGKLPKSLQKAFDDMDEDERAAFMTKFSKSDEGDPVAKALEKVTGVNEKLLKRLDQLEGESEVVKATVEFDDLKGFVKMDDFIAAVIKLRKLDEDVANEMVKQVRASVAQAKQQGGLFKVLGSNGSESDADAKIDKAVKTHQAAHPDDSYEVSYSKVLKEQPELYSEHQEEQSG